MPTISIIIPTLNEAANIQKLLPYLQQYSQGKIKEIIVSDGGSDDGTLNFADALGAMGHQAAKSGRGAQLAAAAALASSEILYFVHADTIPPSSYVQDIHDALDSGYDFGCYRYRFDSSQLILKINAWFTRFPFIWCRGGDQSLFITRTFYDKIGGFDATQNIMEDFDIILRGKKQGGRFRIMPKNVLVSARKYHCNSYLRVNIANLIVFNMWRLGYEPATLKRTYYKLIRHPKESVLKIDQSTMSETKIS